MKALPVVLFAATVACALAGEPKPAAPQVGTAVRFAVSPPLREVAAAAPARRTLKRGEVRELPLGRLPRTPVRRLAAPEAADPVVQRMAPRLLMPSPLLTFEGIGNLDSVYPPDCNGDVGLNHYVEMVNMHMAIYDKATGTNVVAPFLMSSLYAAAGFPAPASTTDDGDPVVLYDHLAHRWMISQFIVSVTPCHEVIAISQTSDPTGAWYLYDFVMPNTKMNDYPHFGVWPDGYYMTDNQFSGFSWAGAGVFAFERAKMLAGDPSASFQYFDLYGVDANFGGMLPADLDGAAPPAGTPCYFAMMDDSAVNSFDALYIWEFKVDWTNASLSTFGSNGHPNYTNAVAPFDSVFSGGRNNIPQAGTSQKLDAIADRLMHRVQYRNFGTYESLVACHTADVGTDHAGVRYYQVRRDLPAGSFSIAEQATFAPDNAHRWMGSAAMDGQGNLAVGYSCSSTDLYPSIRYAGRLSSDPTGGLFQGESVMYAGSGAQTGTGARWGDYTMLGVDPSDDVTFWYVNEYYPVTAAVDWHTRIGSFRLGSAQQGTVRGVVTNSVTGEGIPGALITTSLGFTTLTGTNGAYAIALATGPVTMAASATDYEPSGSAPVDVQLNVTTEQNFALSPVPLRILPHGGLSAAGIEGGPFAPASQAYVLTNTSASSLSWTATVGVAWAGLSASGGTLAAGGATSVVVAISPAADFLAGGSYTGAVSFSNLTAATGQRRALSLAVTPYQDVLFCADFSAGLPAGWLVRTNGAQVSTAAWRFDSPNGRANLTGGSGAYAAVDDDAHGSGVTTDTEMVSAPFTLAGITAPVIEFKTDFEWYESESARVDVSTQGDSGPWSNIWQKTASYNGAESISLATWIGQTNVRVRFQYDDGGGWGYWWQVDDVCGKGVYQPSSGSLSVKPLAGFAASGYAGGPFVDERVYRLTNTSVSTLAWVAEPDVAWATVQPPDGDLPGGGSLDITVRIHSTATTLPPGDYSGTLVFSNVSENAYQTRTLALAVLEPLLLSPATGFGAAGLEGGPFMPSSTVYAVSNASAHDAGFAVTVTSAWFSLSTTGGTLAAGAATAVTGVLQDAALTVPGVYEDALVVSNHQTQAVQSRALTVTVVEIRGDIAVYDSVAPTNNLQLPFGTIAPYAVATQSIIVANLDPPGGRDLTVENIFLGYLTETFDDGFAQGWREDVPADWTVQGGRYVAHAPGANFLTSVYTDSVARSDMTIEVLCSRDGDTGYSQGIALRTSDDFDADSVGQGYLFVMDGSNSFAVFWVNGASFGVLQGWALTTALLPGQTNRLAASAEGSTLRFFINNTIVWSGTDTQFGTGRVALVGYDDGATQPVYHFDQAQVQPARRPVAGVGRKQIYFNGDAQPHSEPTGPARASHTAPVEDPGAPAEPLSPGAEAPPFAVTNLPATPVTLAPGASFSFDVLYAPQGVGTNRNAVTLQSDDNEDPFVSVELTGRVQQGAITGAVTSANSGLGLVGAVVTATGGGSNWVATTTAGGAYRLPVLAGTFTVTAQLANYTTGVVSGVVVTDEASASAHLVLTGSELTYAPTGMHVVLNYGQVQTNTLWLTNSGPLDIEAQLAALVTAGSGPVSVPAFTGSIPASPHAPSIAVATNTAKVADPSAPVIAAPTDRLCYGIDMGAGALVSFHTDDPGTLTTVGSTGANLIPCVDFVDYDFTQLYALDADANNLVRIAVADGTVTIVGAATPASGQSWSGLAAAPDGTLYAASTDVNTSRLYTLDPGTGAATGVGEITGAPGVIAIACDAGGQLYGLDIANDNLLRIDAATGAGTIIGSVGFDANYAQGMDFDEADNILYLAAYNNTDSRGELRTADLDTGNTALIGPFAGNAELCIAVVAQPSPAWLVLPSPTSSIPAASSAAAPVVFDSTVLDNIASTNEGAIAFAGTFVNAAPDLPVTLVLVPDDLGILPFDPMEFSGEVGGPFEPNAYAITYTNWGAGAISWSAGDDAAWLSLSTTGGTLTAGSGGTFAATVNSAADALPVGVYTAHVQALNQSSGVAQIREILLRVSEETQDYFTELFSGANDLDNRMLTFSPLGGAPYYEVCGSNGVSAFATDPTGGTTLSLGDDSFANVNFTGGLRVPFFGATKTNLYVSSNGYLTFGAGDSSYGETVDEHFTLARIAMLFDDLNPSSSGTISWRQLADRVAVTWQNVPQYSGSDQNSFQVELFTNGVLRLTWLGIGATDGLAGLSQGTGTPLDFVSSDLSAYAACTATAVDPVDVTPDPPDDCTPVAIHYRAEGRPLEAISPLYASLSFDGGPASHRLMSGGAGGEWYVTSSVPVGAQFIEFSFRSVSNDVGGVVDDNDGAYWQVYVEGCVGLWVTNPAEPIAVAPTQSAYGVSGYANTNLFTGHLFWSNELSGAVGTAVLARSWSAAGVPLTIGTNTIRFTATNNPQVMLRAADHGTNSAYADNWQDGDAGGSGWAAGGWDLLVWGGTAGHLITTNDPGNLSAGPRAWTLAASNGATAEARREFASALTAGQTLSFRFDNNWIENTYSVGFGLQNAAGSNLFEFMFVGGSNTYEVNDRTNRRATSIPWSGDGWDVSFTRTGGDGYAFTCGAHAVSGQMTAAGDEAPVRLKFWNYSAGTTWQHNFYVNDIRLRRAWASTSVVAVIVRPPAVDSDHDGMDDDWEAVNGLNVGIDDALGNPDGDVWLNWQEYIADTSPQVSNETLRVQVLYATNGVSVVAGPSTTNSRQYDLHISTNMAAGAWTILQSNVTGAADGGMLVLPATGGPPSRALRVGVHVP